MENTDYTNVPQTDSNYDLMQESVDEKENVALVDFKMVTFSLAGKDTFRVDVSRSVFV